MTDDLIKTGIINKLLEIIYLSLDFEKEIRNYGTDVQIAGSEIYLLKMIKEMKNAYITALAKEMNISKAAVSQTAKRLEKKKLVVKTVAPDNKSKYILHLTKKGLRAHEEHMRIEREVREKILQAADILPTQGLIQTEEFLGAVSNNLIEWMKKE
jgi:DNA-binding MarR family transcriptional regulator